MRRTILLLAGVLLPAVALGSDSPKEYDDKTEYVGIEGTWEVVSVESEGKILTPSDAHSDWIMTFCKGEWTWSPGAFAQKGHYELDARKPAWLDKTTTSEPPGANYTAKSLYRIDGDILKEAWDRNSNERPHSFDTNAHDSVVVYTCKRVRK